MHVREIESLERKFETVREWIKSGKSLQLHNFQGPPENFTKVATWVRNQECKELAKESGKKVKFKAFLIISDKRVKSVADKPDNIIMVYLIASKDEIYVTASGVFTDGLLSEVEGDPSYFTDKVQTIMPLEKKIPGGKKCLMLSTEMPQDLF